MISLYLEVDEVEVLLFLIFVNKNSITFSMRAMKSNEIFYNIEIIFDIL